MEKTKTIFISLPYPMSIRNILRNPLYDLLCSKYKIVIFTPLFNDAIFLEEFKRKGVFFYPLQFDYVRNFFARIVFKFHRLGDRFHFATDKKIHGVYMNRYLYKANLWNERQTKFTGLIFNIFPSLNKWMGKFIKNQLDSPYYCQLIEKYKPCLVFTTHPFIEAENQLLVNAEKYGIKTISLIHSWDNLTGKGRIHCIPGQLIVWNEVMKQEALMLYPENFNDKNVHVVGLPQHDYLVNDNWLQDKNDFFQKLGGNPKKKVITYISRGGKYSHYREQENLDVLISGLEKSQFIEESQLFIREVASHDRLQYSDVIGDKENVIYDHPEVSYFPNTSATYQWSSDQNATYHLGNLLQHSDVIINFGSTISLDSVYFNKPLIWSIYRTGSDLQLSKNEHIPDELGMCHLQPILNMKAVTIPNKPSDLIELVNDALRKPDLLKKGRSNLREQYCPYYDGKAGKRIANIIIDTIDKLEYIKNYE
jgi:hypothetical protein